MVDQVITKQELIDAQKDADTLEQVLNGAAGVLITSRLGRQYYTLASVSHINVMTRDEIISRLLIKADKTYVDNALTSFQNGAIKTYPTLSAANADIANIALNTKVSVLSAEDGGDYYKATTNATSLTKSPYDALKQSKDYTDKSIESQNISYINDDNSKFNFVNRHQYNYDAEYVKNNDPTWNAVPPFSLKKGQTILFSVFTAAHINNEEMGSIVIFDTNGVFKKTIVGIDRGFDTTKRVTSSYTATEDCLIGVQSVHNTGEGYDGLDDYVVLKDVILRHDLINLYADIITKENSVINFVNRHQYNYDAEYVKNNDPTWNAVPPFSLKKGQTILFSVFTAAHINNEEMGSIVIFDTNGVFKKTIVGIDRGFDTTKRVTSSYTATEDCLIGVQSVHNTGEGYDGLDDYVVLKGGKAKSDNADFKEFENTASVKWFDEEGFLISYFGDNGVGQNLLLAYSKDGINFKEFLKFVPDNLHTIRDPSIIHHKNGWWYVVHTNTPYGQSISSEKFNIIKSRDLIHWYNVARIGFDNVKNWAPEFFVDSDGSVHIIGSINMSSGAEKFQPYIFSALDDDLSSWSDGVEIQGAFNSATTSTSDSWIDGFMFKIGSKYHFIIKDEAVGHRWLSIFTSSSLKTGFDTILKDGSASWGSVSQKVEAPCVMALENGNYRIYADGLPQYQGGLGQFLMYQDFDSSFNPISSDITKITSDSPMRHGTVLKVKGMQKYLSQSEFVAENVSDSADPTNIQSVLEEMREMKKSLIKAGLMKLS